MIAETIKRQILQRSQGNELNMATLERKANLPRNSLRNILNGKSNNPGISSLVAIAGVLGCTIDDLLDRQPVYKKEMSVKAEITNKLIINLFNETAEKLETCIQDSKLEVSFEQFIKLLNQAYIYALHKNSQKVSVDFIEGLIENRFI